MCKIQVRSLSWEDPLEYSSILAWKILWTEEPGKLQSMGSKKELDMTKRLNNNTDIPHFIIFCFVTLHKYCVFY